jgi:DNA-binding response OmpR family regulator
MKAVLIVTRDETIRRFLQGRFEKKGIETLVATSTDVADQIFALNFKKIGVVLLDDGTPKFGIENADLAKKMRSISRAPVVAMATFGPDRDTQMEYGCTHKCDKADAVKLALELLETQ